MSQAEMSVCAVCRRTPAVKLMLRRNVGYILMRKWYEFDGALCRTHAIQGSLTYLWKTLLFGWWGVISFLVNWLALLANIVALVRSFFITQPEGQPSLPYSFAEWERNRRFGAELGRYVALAEEAAVAREAAAMPPRPDEK
jgi:hypothetical protein